MSYTCNQLPNVSGTSSLPVLLWSHFSRKVIKIICFHGLFLHSCLEHDRFTWQRMLSQLHKYLIKLQHNFAPFYKGKYLCLVVAVVTSYWRSIQTVLP